jgi:hypothetical protein
MNTQEFCGGSLTIEQVAPPQDGGLIPTPSLQKYKIRPVPNHIAQELVVKHHYLHRKAPCSFAFGLFLEEEILGVIMYGTPSSAPLRKGIAGEENASNVIELTRLWVDDSVPRNGESYLIGRTLKLVNKEIIVSFADTAQGHLGIVYQATNWIYTGLSAKRTNWTIAGLDKHCQTIADKFTSQELREKYGDKFTLEPRSRKHRYIYFNCDKNRKKELMKALKYPILPYPKKSLETPSGIAP